MIDIVYKGCEKDLGFDSLCVINKDAAVCDLKDASKLKKKYNLLLYKGDEVRKALENKHIDIIFGLEDHKFPDFLHQRNSGLNHILCKIAHDNDKIICFDFSSILNSKGMKRARIFGRMMQNIRLCRKYKVKMAAASFGEMRNRRDLESLFKVLGALNPKQLFSAVEERIKENKFKKAPEYVCEGVRLKK